jgi:hypothetical protein
LEPLDIQARLEELRFLKEGWLDGEGDAFDPEGMDWLESSVRAYYVAGTPLPHIFPSPGGQVVFQWKIVDTLATLEIDLRDKTAYWHTLDLSSRSDSDEDLNLDGAADWNRLKQRLASISEGNA